MKKNHYTEGALRVPDPHEGEQLLNHIMNYPSTGFTILG